LILDIKFSEHVKLNANMHCKIPSSYAKDEKVLLI